MKTDLYKLRKKILSNPNIFQGISPPYYDYKGNSFNIKCDNSSGIQHTSSVIQTALLDCESANPFEVLGLDFSLIFSLNTPNETNIVKMKILDILSQFSDRLEVRSIDVESGVEEGSMSVSLVIFYIPLGKEVELSGLILGGKGG